MSQWSRRSVAVAGVGLFAALGPRDGRAGDLNRPATQAQFPDVPCMTVVDRSTQPVLHVGYAIPNEDTNLLPDEIPDGRRFQFFAFGAPLLGAPPNWVTLADRDRASTYYPDPGIIDTDPDEVLESGPSWVEVPWGRVTPDDARLPITHEVAAMGVDWDTTSVAQGTWQVWAYTWDPPINAWSPRGGAIKVVDDAAQPEASPPAIFLPPAPEIQPSAGDEIHVAGCVDAMPGSTLTLSWSAAQGAAAPVWHAASEPVAVGAGPVDLDFTVPNDLPAGTLLRFQADVVDPEGRCTVAYRTSAVNVLGGDGSADLDADPYEPCSRPKEDSGCSIGSAHPGTAGPGLLLLPLLAAGRRRRRSRGHEFAGATKPR